MIGLAVKEELNSGKENIMLEKDFLEYFQNVTMKFQKR